MENSLHRSASDQVIAGVCGGLARHLGMDAILVRIIFLVLGFMNGIGVWIYLLLWLFLPLEGRPGTWQSQVRAGASEMQAKARQVSGALRLGNAQTTLLVGLGLMVLGALFLLRNLGFVWLRWLRFGTLWPLLLIALGIAMLIRSTKEY